MDAYQPSKANGKPPNPHSYRCPPWRIALVGNLKDDFEPDLDDPPDAGAEFDRRDTIEAIASALEADGHWVYFCEADHTLPEALGNLRPHICFNIAEGIGGDGREAQVPALCELLGIPYTGSRVVANAISLDKTLTKRIWSQVGLPTAPFQEVKSLEDARRVDLSFPLFVKPASEGTGMGIDPGAVVHNRAELEERVDWVLKAYQQPALVEAYLEGREFTVGFIGNPGDPSRRRHSELYDAGGYHWFPVLEIDTHTSLSPGVYGHDAKSMELELPGAPAYLCPADISESLRTRLVDLARGAAQAIGARDVSRIDLRLGADGQPYLLEINTLPGLNPLISDLCIMAAAEGMPYQILINEILYLAAERFGMPLTAAPVPLPLTVTTPVANSYKAILVSTRESHSGRSGWVQ